MNTLKRWKSNTSAKSVATINTVSSQADTSDNGGEADIPEEEGDGADGARTNDSNYASTSTLPSSPTYAAKDHKPFASSGGLRLTLLSPTTKTLNPGVTIQGIIDVNSLKDCKDLKLVLTGKAAYMIMGKMRYQAALGVNALGGAGYAGAAPLTMRESHTFLQTEIPIWLPDNPTNYKSIHQPQGTGHDNKDSSVLRFEFSIDLPRVKKCTCEAATYALPPTIDLRRFEASGAIVDRSTVEIKYSLSAILDRKGLLKRKQK